MSTTQNAPTQTPPTSLPTPAEWAGRPVVWVVQSHIGGGDDSENSVRVFASSAHALAAVASDMAEETAACEEANGDAGYVAEFGEDTPLWQFAGPRCDGGVLWHAVLPEQRGRDEFGFSGDEAREWVREMHPEDRALHLAELDVAEV